MGVPTRHITTATQAIDLDVDERGRVTNAGDAEWRAAQYIRRYCDREYTVEPPFEVWELELP
ncbi:DUF7677 family protein [Micromonospora rubida]